MPLCIHCWFADLLWFCRCNFDVHPAGMILTLLISCLALVHDCVAVGYGCNLLCAFIMHVHYDFDLWFPGCLARACAHEAKFYNISCVQLLIILLLIYRVVSIYWMFVVYNPWHGSVVDWLPLFAALV